MTHPHDDGTAAEHDPTGMRDLLSGLPGPGPMPDELVTRITAALAAEADAGRAAEGPGAADPPDGQVVVPLPRRSSRLRHLGVAAAVVAALGLGGYGIAVVQGGGASGVDEVAGAASDTSGGSAESRGDARTEADGQTGAGAAPGTEATSAPPALPGPTSGEVVVVMSGAQYTAEGLAPTARSVADGALSQLPDLAAEAPAIGPIGTATGARSCADAHGIPRSAGLLVDVAEVDARPAAVLVAITPEGRTAYAVGRSCTTSTPSLIRGPVSLD